MQRNEETNEAKKVSIKVRQLKKWAYIIHEINVVHRRGGEAQKRITLNGILKYLF